MKKRMIAASLIFAVVLMTSACGDNPSGNEPAASSVSQVQEAGSSVLTAENPSAGKTTGSYTQITQDEAKEMMEKDDGHVIVDVRRQDEYDAGHIPGAILIPNESIGTEMPEELPDPDQVILIYCRSGNRSKQAAQKLSDMGYTNIYEFGGIIDWTGDVVTGEEKSEKAEKNTNAMKLMIEDKDVPVTWEENPSVDELKAALPLTIEMSMYGGFEQVGPIGRTIVSADERITTNAGDIVLYSGNQIVVFYGSNTWEYTRLGHIDLSREEMTELLGADDVTITITEG